MMSAVGNQAQFATKPQRDRQFNGFIMKLTAKYCAIRYNVSCRLSNTRKPVAGFLTPRPSAGFLMLSATKPAAGCLKLVATKPAASF